MFNFNKHFKMEVKDAIKYAKEKLNIFDKDANLKGEEIGDGNINYVFRIWDENTGKAIVIKQADVLLRTSGRPLDTDRIRIEAEALKIHEKFSPGLVPKVYDFDPIMRAISMEDISDHGNLREELLKCRTFPKLADHISTFMVNSMLPSTDLVVDSPIKKDRVAKFINKDMCKISEDLVFTEPYIDYKGRNIVLEKNLEFVKRELYEDKHLRLEAGKLKNNFMNNAQALIHGDLHSGSIFVTRDSTKIIDPEFAFYGPIGYDIGNVIGNLFFPWANAYVTRKEEEIKEFIYWLEDTIVEIIQQFKEKFRTLYKEIVTDVMAKEDLYMEWYLGTILSDAAGSAGLEIIRRVVGDSKVIDITNIRDIDKRVKAERLLILAGKEFIMNRHIITTGQKYIEIFKNKMKKF